MEFFFLIASPNVISLLGKKIKFSDKYDNGNSEYFKVKC